MSELKQAWEYCFIHSSATGRGDEEIGPCLTYEKSVAFGKGCFKQRELFVSTQPEATKPAQDLGAAILAIEYGADYADPCKQWAFDAGFKAALKAAAALASPADALVAGDSETAKDAERLTCLKDVSTVELALEITLRNGPRFKCMGCKTYHNAPGKWDTCPCCGRKGYLCGSFEQDIESQDWRDWERRCINAARQAKDGGK